MHWLLSVIECQGRPRSLAVGQEHKQSDYIALFIRILLEIITREKGNYKELYGILVIHFVLIYLGSFIMQPIVT